jgi:hypothetical protein
MSKTMQINPPQGFKFQSVDQSSGAINLVEIPKDIKERIKSFVDVLIVLGIDGNEFVEQTKNLPADELAYKQLKLIVQAFNEGWTPDWTNGKWDKYYPWFKMGSPSGGGFSYGGYADWRGFVCRLAPLLQVCGTSKTCRTII